MALPAQHPLTAPNTPMPFFSGEKFLTFDDMCDTGKDDAQLGGMLGCIVLDDLEETPGTDELPDELTMSFDEHMKAQQKVLCSLGKEKRETWEDYVAAREDKAWRYPASTPNNAPSSPPSSMQSSTNPPPSGIKLSLICGPSPTRARPPLHPLTPSIVIPPIPSFPGGYRDTSAYPLTPTSPYPGSEDGNSKPWDSDSDPVTSMSDDDTTQEPPRRARPLLVSRALSVGAPVRRKLSIVGPRKPPHLNGADGGSGVSPSVSRVQRRAQSETRDPYPKMTSLSHSFSHGISHLSTVHRGHSSDVVHDSDSSSDACSEFGEGDDGGSYRGYASSTGGASRRRRSAGVKRSRNSASVGSQHGERSDGRKFWCHRCETSFTRAHDLKRHNKRKHPELFVPSRHSTGSTHSAAPGSPSLPPISPTTALGGKLGGLVL
ncbi:hypothetical protein M427DRAFT_155146 [Gonapodya prolifera JEL478]|uniref:C2H2-type domain-containing protein n=1 Tax=Gonapodya prolifera (strain JEL478) TaxID=1344416 RepID=A0A139AGS5_GONPJ|nr:hypothetical protein M427DRAFT_155146 [Gonapodya prolifera JEL478]|eukprot:KXS15889.1 hypothetical protein M427DRAFT_155146 [Gonapodya prolifera JEL478]